MENKEIICTSFKYAFKIALKVTIGLIILFTLTSLLVAGLESIGLNNRAIFMVSLIIMLFIIILTTFFCISYIDYKNGRK